MKRFHDFWRYNDQLYERCARILVDKWADLNTRQAMLVLMNGNVTHLKRHAQIRIMHKFMMNAISLLSKEQHKV